MLWSIFAYLFCASATNGCYFMEIDGYLTAQEPFVVVSGSVQRVRIVSSRPVNRSIVYSCTWALLQLIND